MSMMTDQTPELARIAEEHLAGLRGLRDAIMNQPRAKAEDGDYLPLDLAVPLLHALEVNDVIHELLEGPNHGARLLSQSICIRDAFGPVGKYVAADSPVGRALERFYAIDYSPVLQQARTGRAAQTLEEA